MSEKDNAPVIKQIEAEKTNMYHNFVNRRMMICLISVIVGFIIYASIFVIGYTVREQHWQETTFRIVEQFTAPTGVSNGQKTD